MEDFANPRGRAVAEMKRCTGPDTWEANMAFISALREELARHPVTRNPAIELLNSGSFDHATLRGIHLEYRHAIVQTFTDALLMAQFQSRQLEPRLAPGSKMLARFLLTLNTLDEFGFRPGTGSDGYYLGNPAYAHYPLFENVLDDLGIGRDERVNYAPSGIAQRVRQTLENTFGSFVQVSALLAVAEEEVILYSPPLRQAVHALGLEVNRGYYYVHGVSDDDSAEAADDDHQDDLWYILAHAMQPADYDGVRSLCLAYCDQWDEFWLEQIPVQMRSRETERRAL